MAEAVPRDHDRAGSPPPRVSDVERAVNYNTLQTLRLYSVGTLGRAVRRQPRHRLVAVRPGAAAGVAGSPPTAEEIARDRPVPADPAGRPGRRAAPAGRHARRHAGPARRRVRRAAPAGRRRLARAAQPAGDHPDERGRRAGPRRRHRGRSAGTPDRGRDRATARMSRLVEDLLATARRNAPAFAEADVDLAAIAAEASEEFRLLAARPARRPAAAGGGRHRGQRRPGRAAAGAGQPARATRSSWPPERTEVLVAAGRVARLVLDGGPGRRAGHRAGRRATGSSTGSGRASAPTRARGPGTPGSVSPSSGRSPRATAGAVALHSTPGVGSTFVVWVPSRARTGDSADGDVPAAPAGRRPAAATRPSRRSWLSRRSDGDPTKIGAGVSFHRNLSVRGRHCVHGVVAGRRGGPRAAAGAAPGPAASGPSWTGRRPRRTSPTCASSPPPGPVSSSTSSPRRPPPTPPRSRSPPTGSGPAAGSARRPAIGKLARELRLPVYEAAVVGYPKRMRDWNARRKRESGL